MATTTMPSNISTSRRWTKCKGQGQGLWLHEPAVISEHEGNVILPPPRSAAAGG